MILLYLILLFDFVKYSSIYDIRIFIVYAVLNYFMNDKSIISRTPVSLDAQLLNEYIRLNFTWTIYN